MKIVSKFHDYYDNVQGVMYDDFFTFIRKSEQVYLDSNLIDMPYYSEPENREFFLIGFCGEIYPAHRYTFNPDTTRTTTKIDKYLKNKKFVTVATGTRKVKYYTSYNIIEAIELNPNRVQRYFKRKDTEIKILDTIADVKRLKLFDEYQTPIFSIKAGSGHREVILNTSPTLREFSFESQFDPYSAFQELVMWIGNKAVAEYPPQITDDIVLRDAKGFDKWSFKTMKGQKRKRGGKK